MGAVVLTYHNLEFPPWKPRLFGADRTPRVGPLFLPEVSYLPQRRNLCVASYLALKPESMIAAPLRCNAYANFNLSAGRERGIQTVSPGFHEMTSAPAPTKEASCSGVPFNGGNVPK